MALHSAICKPFVICLNMTEILTCKDLISFIYLFLQELYKRRTNRMYTNELQAVKGSALKTLVGLTK